MNTNMNIVLEARFFVDDEGVGYTDTSYEYAFWGRYLTMFETVTIIARALRVSKSEVQEGWKKVTGARVRLQPLPYYHGLLALGRRLPMVLRAVSKISRGSVGPTIFRMPSLLGAFFFLVKPRLHRAPYAVEMVGDSEAVFSTLHKAARPIGRVFTKRVKKILSNASAVVYVEPRVLPEKYPNHAGRSFVISDIELGKAFFKSNPREYTQPTTHFISIGSLDRLYKGPDVVLKALAILKSKGIICHFTWVGDGVMKAGVERMAVELGVADMVAFVGSISDREVLQRKLEKADIFVLASRTEGMPRALIEAMAKGLPCIGSAVGGIPSLLEDDSLFQSGDSQELAALMQALASDPERLTQQSARNLQLAREFRDEKLDAERREFFTAVKTMQP